jgi:hypothetical protein
LARLMATETGKRPANARVDALLQAGTDAFRTGDKARAHDYWREAATLDPYDERVWMSLLKVIESPVDRRVCLENIVSINPLNAQARQQLRQYQERERREAELRKARRRANARTLRRALLSGLTIGVLAALLGIFIAVVMFGLGMIPPPEFLVR